MTAEEKEIQGLRRKVKLLEREVDKLKQVHQLDMAEIVYMRRLIDFFMEAAE